MSATTLDTGDLPSRSRVGRPLNDVEDDIFMRAAEKSRNNGNGNGNGAKLNVEMYSRAKKMLGPNASLIEVLGKMDDLEAEAEAAMFTKAFDAVVENMDKAYDKVVERQEEKKRQEQAAAEKLLEEMIEEEAEASRSRSRKDDADDKPSGSETHEKSRTRSRSPSPAASPVASPAVSPASTTERVESKSKEEDDIQQKDEEKDEKNDVDEIEIETEPESEPEPEPKPKPESKPDEENGGDSPDLKISRLAHAVAKSVEQSLHLTARADSPRAQRTQSEDGGPKMAMKTLTWKSADGGVHPSASAATNLSLIPSSPSQTAASSVWNPAPLRTKEAKDHAVLPPSRNVYSDFMDVTSPKMSPMASLMASPALSLPPSEKEKEKEKSKTADDDDDKKSDVSVAASAAPSAAPSAAASAAASDSSMPALEGEDANESRSALDEAFDPSDVLPDIKVDARDVKMRDVHTRGSEALKGLPVENFEYLPLNANSKNLFPAAMPEKDFLTTDRYKITNQFPLEEALNLEFLKGQKTAQPAKNVAKLLNNKDNAVIYFYMEQCPFCEMLKPTYDLVAKNIHNTNHLQVAVPIIVAKVNGPPIAKEVRDMEVVRDALDPAAYEKFMKTYPTILLKRSDGKMMLWNSEIPRTYDNLLALFAEFFCDDTLKPLYNDLHNVMNAKDPKFVFFYDNGEYIVPRFVPRLDPAMIDVRDGNAAISSAFRVDPKLREGGLAIPANQIMRFDIRMPSIFDTATNKEHNYGDAALYVIKRIRALEDKDAYKSRDGRENYGKKRLTENERYPDYELTYACDPSEDKPSSTLSTEA